MTNSHNSYKTCSIAKSNLNGHLSCHVGHSMNKIHQGVWEEMHTQDVQTYVHMYGEVQILMPTYNFVGGIKMIT